MGGPYMASHPQPLKFFRKMIFILIAISLTFNFKTDLYIFNSSTINDIHIAVSQGALEGAANNLLGTTQKSHKKPQQM